MASSRKRGHDEGPEDYDELCNQLRGLKVDPELSTEQQKLIDAVLADPSAHWGLLHSLAKCSSSNRELFREIAREVSEGSDDDPRERDRDLDSDLGSGSGSDSSSDSNSGSSSDSNSGSNSDWESESDPDSDWESESDPDSDSSNWETDDDVADEDDSEDNDGQYSESDTDIEDVLEDEIFEELIADKARDKTEKKEWRKKYRRWGEFSVVTVEEYQEAIIDFDSWIDETLDPKEEIEEIKDEIHYLKYNLDYNKNVLQTITSESDNDGDNDGDILVDDDDSADSDADATPDDILADDDDSAASDADADTDSDADADSDSDADSNDKVNIIRNRKEDRIEERQELELQVAQIDDEIDEIEEEYARWDENREILSHLYELYEDYIWPCQVREWSDEVATVDQSDEVKNALTIICDACDTIEQSSESPKDGNYASEVTRTIPLMRDSLKLVAKHYQVYIDVNECKIWEETRTTDLIIDRDAFTEIVKEIVLARTLFVRFGDEAIDALQTAAEDYIQKYFSQANLIAARVGSDKVTIEDFALLAALNAK